MGDAMVKTMIRIHPAPTFEATVNLNVIGQAEPVPARFVFRSLTRKHLASLLVLLGLHKRWWGARVVAYLRLCWRAKKLGGMFDVYDELIYAWDGFDVPYSRVALRALFAEFPRADLSIFVAYLENQEDARRKN